MEYFQCSWKNSNPSSTKSKSSRYLSRLEYWIPRLGPELEYRCLWTRIAGEQSRESSWHSGQVAIGLETEQELVAQPHSFFIFIFFFFPQHGQQIEIFRGTSVYRISFHRHPPCPKRHLPFQFNFSFIHVTSSSCHLRLGMATWQVKLFRSCDLLVYE